MHTIGQLTYDIQNDQFRGKVLARTFQGKVKLIKAQKRSQHAPDYEVFHEEGFQTGSAWLKKFTNKEGSFLSITLDNDGMDKPLNVTAFPQDGDKNILDVIWKREKVNNGQKSAENDGE